MVDGAIDGPPPAGREPIYGQQRQPLTSAQEPGWSDAANRGTPNLQNPSPHPPKLDQVQEPPDQRRSTPQNKNAYSGGVDVDGVSNHHREYMQPHQPEERYGQAPLSARGCRGNSEYGSHYPRQPYLDIRVYSTPYAFTANSEPLFIQYGTPSAEIAATAVLPIGNRYTYSTHYDHEGHDAYTSYHQNMSHVHQGYSPTDPYRYNYRPSDYYQRPPAEEGMHYQSRTPRPISERRYANLSTRDPRSYPEYRYVGTRTTVEGDHAVTEDKNGTEDLPIVEPRCEARRCSDEAQEGRQGDREEEIGTDRERNGNGAASNSGKASCFKITQKGTTGRITWTEELHKEFLKAVDDIGLEHAVPMSILNKMKVEGLTREQVASHLQKHRSTLKKEREVKERALLLSAAAKSVIERDSTLAKRNLTAEEVLSVVEQEAKANGESLSPISGGDSERKRKISVRNSLKKSQGKRNSWLSPNREKDGEWKGKRLRRYLPKG